MRVADGVPGGIAWSRFIDSATNADEKTQIKRALLQYCRRDTFALAQIIEELVKDRSASFN